MASLRFPFCPDSYESITERLGLAEADGALTGPELSVYDPADPWVRRSGTLIGLDRAGKQITLATGRGALVLDFSLAKTELVPPEGAAVGDAVETPVGLYYVVAERDGGRLVLVGAPR